MDGIWGFLLMWQTGYLVTSLYFEMVTLADKIEAEMDSNDSSFKSTVKDA